MNANSQNDVRTQTLLECLEICSAHEEVFGDLSYSRAARDIGKVIQWLLDKQLNN